MKLEPNQLKLPSGKVITFNDQQFDGINKIKEWYKSNTKEFFVLAGFPGTGKTTIIKKIIDGYFGGIAVSAPTHKAKKVITNTTKKQGLTLHSLLGLRPDLELDNFNPNDPKFNPIALPKICDYNMVIIDEASMINKELYGLIKEKTQHSRTKVLFMGDPAQIPPVGEQESIVFNQQNNILHQLTKSERQNDTNPLAFIYDGLRNNLTDIDGGYKRITNINDLGEGVRFTLNKREFRTHILDKFSASDFSKDTDFCKVISWRNETVMKSNIVIRNELFGADTDIVVIGDVLMGYRSITNAKQTANIIENSGDYVVVDKGDLEENAYGIKGYPVKLRESVAWGEYKFQNVFIININDHENLHTYAEMHDFLRDMGKANKKMWPKYYEFRRHNLLMKTITQFRDGQLRGRYDTIVKDLDYGFAITGHKCLSENSMILTINGNVLLKNISVGDYVCVGSNKYRKVLNKFNSGIKKSYKLITKCGYELICSEDHKILNKNNEFIELINYKIGDFIPINRNRFDGDINVSDRDINYYIGLLVADGSYSGNNKRDKYRIDLTIGFDDDDNIEFIRKFYDKSNIKYGERVKGRCVDIYISNKQWREYLLSLGLLYVKGSSKSVPESIKRGSFQDKSNFISGLFDGDGSISKRGRIILVNNSKTLINEVQQLLLEFGIISYIRIEKKSYRLYVLGTSVNDFKKYISFRLRRKIITLNEYNVTIKSNIDFIPLKDEIFSMVRNDIKQKDGMLQKNIGLSPIDYKRFPDHVKHLSYNNLHDIIKLYSFNNKPINESILKIKENYYFYDEIIDIIECGEEQMYDLEINEIHQYIANGFIVHNCQGSTYEHVFVMENDINMNRIIKERNQIKYVAYTRPTTTATILTTKLD